MVKLSQETFFGFKKFAFFSNFIDTNKLRNDSLSIFLCEFLTILKKDC